jgi:hypothetical protein
MSRPLRIANCSGFYGDRRAAAREMVEGGPIDVLTGDYLAELTMLILHRKAQRGRGGYASTFLEQMGEVLGACVDRGIKVVTNAGGLDPAGLADELRLLADELGLRVRVAHLEGDDLLPRLHELQEAGAGLTHLDTGRPFADLPGEPVTANAYLGAWGIVEALDADADIVVCPRVTDASLVVGPAAWHHGWARDDWDALAGAVAVGHVLECGAQATGGNYAFFQEVPGLEHPGFPLAEVAADGSAVITKHPGTGGLVSTGTVTAQLLYEIDAPAYPGPDVTTHFDTARLTDDGPDRVRLSEVRGSPPPPDVKVAINYFGGFRNQMSMVVTGLDVEAKAALAERTLWQALGGRDRFAHTDVRLVRSDRPDADVNAEATAQLRITVTDPDPDKVGRAFADRVTEMTLASYPGFFTTAPPGSAKPYGVYWPALVPASEVRPVVVTPDRRRVEVAPPPAFAPLDGAAPPDEAGTHHRTQGVPEGPTRRAPLGTVIGARSGDKGGNANVGLWARSDAGWAWLDAYLTVERFRELLPEADGLTVRRHRLANLRALNFVVVGLLDEGVAATARPDPQAKGLGEYLRSRLVDLPESVLADMPPRPTAG